MISCCFCCYSLRGQVYTDAVLSLPCFSQTRPASRKTRHFVFFSQNLLCVSRTCEIRGYTSAGSVGIPAAYAWGPSWHFHRFLLQLDTCGSQSYSPDDYYCLTLGRKGSPCSAQHGSIRVEDRLSLVSLCLTLRIHSADNLFILASLVNLHVNLHAYNCFCPDALACCSQGRSRCCALPEHLVPALHQTLKQSVALPTVVTTRPSTTAQQTTQKRGWFPGQEAAMLECVQQVRLSVSVTCWWCTWASTITNTNGNETPFILTVIFWQ